MLLLRTVACFVLLNVINGADILLLSSLASVSHSRWYGIMAKLLATNGHQVVVLDTDRNFFEHPNITHRIMEGGYGWLKGVEQQVKLDPKGLESLVEADSIIDNLLMVTNTSFIGCDVLLKGEGTKKFMEEFRGKKFDVILADGFCESFYAFVSVFGNPPLIPTCPFLDVFSSDRVGLFDNPSYVPFHFSSFSTKMSFVDRLTNTIYILINNFLTHYYSIPNCDKVIKEVFGPSAPSLNDILNNNVPLVMTGFSHVLQGAKPLPPSYIPIPGLHAEFSQPLPKDIKSFLDGAKDGAILFSMGSNFKSILMSEEKREMFLSVFRKIPQKVIWKLELENDTGIPPNVMITKWLPQNDILRHPNVKAFISHGGLLGTQEAVYHGVPIIGIPVMFDQVHNLEKLQDLGVGIRLHYKHLNRKNIALHVDRILNDPSYMIKMKALSAAFRDTPESSQKRALFWIEYVIRNAKNGNKYIRPASLDLDWTQRLLLDVIGFTVFCLVIVLLIIKIILKTIYKMICGSRSAKVNLKRKVQ